MPYAAAPRFPAAMPAQSEDRLPHLPRVAELRVVPQPEEGAEREEEASDEAGLPQDYRGRPIDLRIFRPDAFEAVWSEVVGARAAQARKALTPEAWRRLWLRGYAHLRKEDPGFYAPNAYGLEQAIAVLAPLIRRIEADFREAEIRHSRLQLRSWSRWPPSAATLSRWLRMEAELSLAMAGARRLS